MPVNWGSPGVAVILSASFNSAVPVMVKPPTPLSTFVPASKIAASWMVSRLVTVMVPAEANVFVPEVEHFRL